MASTTTQNAWVRRTFILIFMVLVLSGVALLFITIGYVQERSIMIQDAQRNANAQTATAVEQIDTNFAAVMQTAEQLAADIEGGALPFDQIEARLQADMTANPNVDGYAVTFEPFAFDPDTELFWIYAFRQAGQGIQVSTEPPYNYTLEPVREDDPATSWYRNPLAAGEPIWNAPYFATAAQKYLVEYAVPFRAPGSDTFIGVITIDYTLSDMRRLISELELGTTGYGFIIDQDGTLLAHPNPDQIVNTTIFDIAEQSNNLTMSNGAERALNGEAFTFENTDQLTGQRSWVFYEPIPSTGWALGVVLNQSDFLPNPRARLIGQITIGLVGGLSLYALLMLVLRVYQGTPRRLWVGSSLWTLICVALIVFIWQRTSAINATAGVEVNDQASIERYLNTYIRNADLSIDELTMIPTGIVLQAVDFPSPKSVIINGYIWQRYADDLPNDIVAGVALPQILGPEFTFEEVLREHQDDETVIVWNIGMELRQTFNPSQFPFDNRDIRVRLSPQDLSQNIVLIPDFSAYYLQNPVLLPGIAQGVELNNWAFERSAYSYEAVTFKSNLGLNLRDEFTTTPELVFTVNLNRYFVGPFIAYLLPGLVTALMMFGFMLRERPEDVQEEDDIVNALNYGAALFFVIAIIHTALRDNIAAVGITYLEHLYIILYVMIVLVAVNTFLHVQRPDLRWVQHHNNLIPKLFYWPTIASALLISTLFTFVY